jgi:hypothetical protein
LGAAVIASSCGVVHTHTHKVSPALHAP